MGHVVNPIDHRLYTTLYYDKIWHTRYNSNYSFICNKFSLAATYSRMFLNCLRLRRFALFSGTKVFWLKNRLHLYVFFYSSMVYNLVSTLTASIQSHISAKQESYLLAMAIAEKKKIQEMRSKSVGHSSSKVVHSKKKEKRRKKKKIDNKTMFRRLGLSVDKLKEKFYKQPGAVNKFIFNKTYVLYFLKTAVNFLLRRFLLDFSLHYFKFIFIKDLTGFLSLPVNVNFVVVPQQAMTAHAWATFIKYKLKRRSTFGQAMSSVAPILNRMLRNKSHTGLLGYKVACNGRTSRRGRASSYLRSRGKFPYSSNYSYVSYGFQSVILKNSICGVKVWLFYKGAPRLEEHYKELFWV